MLGQAGEAGSLVGGGLGGGRGGGEEGQKAWVSRERGRDGRLYDNLNAFLAAGCTMVVLPSHFASASGMHWAAAATF